MDISDALRALNNGKKVRQVQWSMVAEVYGPLEKVGATRWDHLYIERRPGHTPALMVRHGDGSASHFVMNDHCLQALDWETV